MISYQGVEYATLDGASPSGTGNGCQSSYIALPTGWQLAPANSASRFVAGSYNWATHMLVTDYKLCFPFRYLQYHRRYLRTAHQSELRTMEAMQERSKNGIAALMARQRSTPVETEGTRSMIAPGGF